MLSTKNFIIIGGGPMALLSAYYIKISKIPCNILILDNRNSYTRHSWGLTINDSIVTYLKYTFNDIILNEFLDKIKNNIFVNNNGEKCDTLAINNLEHKLIEKLKEFENTIFTIKCYVSLNQNNDLLILPTINQSQFWIKKNPKNPKNLEHPALKTIITTKTSGENIFYTDNKNIEYLPASNIGLISFDSITINEHCCESQNSFIKDFNADYIFNCTGGRLNTKTYWNSTIEDTEKYLLKLTNKCIGITLKSYNLIGDNNDDKELNQITEHLSSAILEKDNPLWYIRVYNIRSIIQLEKYSEYDFTPKGLHVYDKLSVLKPCTEIQIQLDDDSLKKYPLFNIGDSIMTVNHKKKLGLALGITNVRIILNMIMNNTKSDEIYDKYVEKIKDNFYELSKKLLLFCNIEDLNNIIDCNLDGLIEVQNDLSKSKNYISTSNIRSYDQPPKMIPYSLRTNNRMSRLKANTLRLYNRMSNKKSIIPVHYGGKNQNKKTKKMKTKKIKKKKIKTKKLKQQKLKQKKILKIKK